MNIDDYFVAPARANPDYAAAANEVSTAQDFADEVVRRRIALAWTQDDLAHSARTTQSVVSRVENGVANLTVATMDKFRYGSVLQRPIESTLDSALVLRPR